MVRKICELKGYEDFVGYSVSDDGRVYSHFKRHDTRYIITDKPYRELKHIIDGKGYHRVDLHNMYKRANASVHRLVALAFIPNPNNYPQIDHIDCDKSNNNVSNLEWVTGQENHRRKMANGLNVAPKGERHYFRVRGYKENEYPCCKAILQLDKTGKVIAEYPSIKAAGEVLGIERSNISKVLHNVTQTAGGYMWKFKVEGSTTIETA